MDNPLAASRHVCVFSAISDVTERCGACGKTQQIDTGRNSPAEIERRARETARAYAKSSPMLRHWVQQGNTLPECYR